MSDMPGEELVEYSGPPSATQIAEWLKRAEIHFAEGRHARAARLVALTHHERWDGSGYPDGLKGEQIPLQARIVAISDVFDALTSERPYKRAWSMNDAAAEIEKGSGSHFDPALVRVFLRVYPEIRCVYDSIPGRHAIA